MRSFPPTTKFSYVRARAVTKEDKADDLKSKRERIIANPLLRNQHLIMDTCDSNGELTRRTISKGKMKLISGKYSSCKESREVVWCLGASK